MMKPIVFKLAGAVLLLLSLVDLYQFHLGWHLHALYVGLALFLSGHLFSHLERVQQAARSLSHQVTDGALNEHVVQIRTLLDGVHNEIRAHKLDPDFVEHVVQARTLLDALLVEARRR